MTAGWIKLHRKFLESSLANQPIAGWVWMHMLLRANWERRQLHTGEWLEPGELIIGQRKFAGEIGVTYKQLRLAITKLEKCGNVARSGASGKYTKLTICNWEKYQAESIEGELEGGSRAEVGRK